MRNPRGSTKRLRIASVATFVVVVLAVFAALGGAGLAQSAISLAQYQYGKKVTICHKGKATIRVSIHAWPAHRRHNDTLGSCPAAHKRHRGEHGKKVGQEHGGMDSHGSAKAGRGHGNDNGHGNGNGNGQGNDKSNHGSGQGSAQAESGHSNSNSHGQNKGK